MPSNKPTQLDRVRNYIGMYGPTGFVLAAAAQHLSITQTALSARLRDLRAEGYEVNVITSTVAGVRHYTYKTSAVPVNAKRAGPSPVDVRSRELALIDKVFGIIDKLPEYASRHAMAQAVGKELAAA